MNIFEVEETRKSAVETVVEKIKLLLIQKKLKPGDMIPSETVLAESLKVSRGSIREAMKILSAYGIIEIKRGSGTFISSSSNRKLFDPLLFNVLIDGSDMYELIEVRHMIERSVIHLIIQHASDEDLNQLKEEMKNFTNYHNSNPEKINEANHSDIDYHRLMGRITHNPIMENIYNFIIDMFETTIDSHRGFDAHVDLHNAIISRNEEQAMNALNKHTKVWSKPYTNTNK